MLSNAQREHLRSLVRPMQIIVFALAFGVLMFLAVTLVIKPAAPPAGQNRGAPLISYIAFLAAFVLLVAWAVVPRLIARQWRESIVEGKPPSEFQVAGMQNVPEEMRQLHPLVGMYQTTLIIACALLEGAAFFNVLAYFLERQPLNLLVAVIFVLLILNQFPTASRLVSWIEDESATIERLQSMRRV